MQLAIKLDATKYEKYLKDSPKQLRDAIQNTIYKASLLIERGAKINSPVDTGRMRSSISTDIIPLQSTTQPHVNYAIFVHEGTRYIRARPFLTDAARDVEKQIPDILGSEVNKIE